MTQFRRLLRQERCRRAGVTDGSKPDLPEIRLSMFGQIRELAEEICRHAVFPIGVGTAPLICVDTLQTRIPIDSTRELIMAVRSDGTDLFFQGSVREGVQIQHETQTTSFGGFVRWTARTVAQFEYHKPNVWAITKAIDKQADEVPPRRTRVIELD